MLPDFSSLSAMSEESYKDDKETKGHWFEFYAQ